MSEETFFKDLSTIEEDQQRLESIDRLQKAFMDVRKSYSQEYNDSLNHVLSSVKEKIKRNHGMVDAVNMYVSKYVSVSKQHDAREELYNILAAEMLQTIQTLQHTTCEIM